ncbi:hemolysin III family protein [Hydrogenophaga sp.]|uniref:PAQR family membrane homeostasis protein TrhA n=1 Tax=Hydrogenophaga sp. TaxID=1904254 RepID=UPI0019A6E5AA|nr:hemolysin III family protein [Hydrogenophaga sp.]MBD3894228.1 hemolysin III family protein [Hydrogenophaga sp.]
MIHGERFNSISHLLGALLAVAGTALLVTRAALLGDPWKIVSFSIYGATLMALYLASTLYHSLRGRAKAVFKKIDHCAIYLLIAGSYTPFALVTLHGPRGWLLLGLAWGLAAVGIVQELWLARGKRLSSLLIYLLMGWLALLVVVPLWHALTPAGLAWLVVGGACYTLGLVFYVGAPRIRHGHGIWHLFVLAGSACHYLAILLYVA